MNYLVFLDPQAGELEKILSGIKSMLLRESDPALPPAQGVRPGDSLYFLRNDGDHTLRVRATVVRLLPSVNSLDQDLSHTLKELQPRLQLTENQYNDWSTKEHVQLVEFDCAHKIDVMHVASHKITGRSAWIAFEELDQIVE
jgi:hypothetical protein